MPGILIALFLVLFGIVLAGISLGLKVVEDQRKRRVSAMLRTVDASHASEVPGLVLDDPEINGSGLITRVPLLAQVHRAIQQAGLDWTVQKLIGFSVVGLIAGLFLGSFARILIFPWLSMLALGILFGCFPWLLLYSRRTKRLKDLEEQFPEALDFLSRSMRAGHAFSISLEMLGQEAAEPLGAEIRTVFNELNLGAPLEDALDGLLRRVPLEDYRFFASAIMLQRQTGGNMSEILNRLAYVIRERFRLRGQVKAASAHARITSLVLTVLPALTAVALMIIAPGYLPALAKDPDGKWLIVAALLGQILGYLTMKRIVNIKV